MMNWDFTACPLEENDICKMRGSFLDCGIFISVFARDSTIVFWCDIFSKYLLS